MPWPFIAVLMFLVPLLTVGCTTGSQLDVTIQESDRGGVYLERIPTRQFQATHPVRFAPELIARSLQGVMVREGKGLLQAFSTNQIPTIPAFSQDDITFLAPAIANGLSQAASDQQIEFRVVQAGYVGSRERIGAGVGSAESPLHRAQLATTAGRLFVYGRSLYLTLHQFRQGVEPPDTINMPNRRLPEPSGLRNRTVLFVPESALRPDIYAPAFASEDGLTTLVIDYDALAKAPVASQPAIVPSQPSSAIAPGTAPPLTNDLDQIKEQMKKKETEVEELRKELQEIKRQLGGQQVDPGKAPSSKQPLGGPGSH